MPKSVKSKSSKALRVRFRVLCGEDVALGPGKVQLLKCIQDTGSIRQAAAQMEMSYMRAWGLVRTMNLCFKEPLVESVRGGSQRGGAKLTEVGSAVLELYQQIENESMAATEASRDRLFKLLKDAAK